MTTSEIHIGLLTPQTANRPHFENFKRLLPHEVTLTIEGLNLVRSSLFDLVDKSDVVVSKALEMKRRFPIQGGIVTGAPTAILNPALESKVSTAVGLPVVTAVSAAVAALKAVSAKRLIVVTPFAEEMNARLKRVIEDSGFTILSCPQFEDQNAVASAKASPEELFRRVESAFKTAPTAHAIYFQGATLDPLLIIERLEQSLKVPVIASNPAMLWLLLSLLRRKYSIQGYGKLLATWPEHEV
jgi:maleate cis-trans isomerase